MTKKFKRRLDIDPKLITIEGLNDIPTNPDGSVVFGNYVIHYVWDYDGIRVTKPRTLEFRAADNRIEFRKNGVGVNSVERIHVISSQSQSPYSPTFYSSIDTTLPSDITAHYVERDIDDNITSEMDITSTITTDTSLADNSVIGNKLGEGIYVIHYEVEYNNGSTIYNKSISREIVATSYVTQEEEEPLYTFKWENTNLPAINKNVGDSFPSTAEMTSIIPIGVLTETATGETIRLQTAITTPTNPFGGVTTSKTFLIQFEATNLLDVSGGDTGLTDDIFNTYVVPQLKTRSIQYNLANQNPQSVPIEITFSPATLSDIVFQDYESGSNPSPASYHNSGLFPSEADLLSGVTATYLDDNGATQSLAVSLTRPTGSLYNGVIKGFFFDNDEVIMHIPRIWPITYEATAPDGTEKQIVRNVIIEDTIAPIFSPAIPTTIEKGTSYTFWNDRELYGHDLPRFDYTYPGPRYGVTIDIGITEEQFASLDHGDTFTTTYTTTDPSGNTRLVSQTTTCQDTTLPTVRFESSLVFATGSNPTAAELKVGVTTNDLSQPVTVTVDDTGVNYSSQGFYTASYTISDPHGNSVTQTRNIFVKDYALTPTSMPTGANPVQCTPTPNVPNIYLDGSEVIANMTTNQWLEGLFARQDGEDITFKIVVSQDSINTLPVKPDGKLDYDNNSDGFLDVEVTPYFINYEIQDEHGTPLVCTSRLVETIDVVPPTIYDIPNPILIYKSPNDGGTGQSSTTPSDVITDIVSRMNVVDNVDGTGFTTATLEGIGQGAINTGADIVRTLIFTDSSSNETRYEITIQFTANKHPVLTLTGDNPYTLTSAVLPSDPGATATDHEDGTLTPTSDWVEVFAGNLSQGKYSVKYSAEDSSGVVVEKTRTVIVPYFNPTITLVGDDPFVFTEDPELQDDPYATAYSVKDGDITANITSDWDEYIDASTDIGSYPITYSVTDSEGNSDSITRTVTFSSCASDPVIDNTPSILDSITNLHGGATYVDGIYIDTPGGYGYAQGSWSADYTPDNVTDDFSFSAFWKLNTAADNDLFWLFARLGNLQTAGWGMRVKKLSNTEVSYNIIYPNNANYIWTDTITTTALGQFNHVAFTYSDGDWSFYHNGTLEYTETSKNLPTNIPSQFQLGNGWGNGYIAQVQAFKDTYLSGHQIGCLNDKRGTFDSPVITLIGNNPLFIYNANLSTVTDPNATASDLTDGDITADITSDWDNYIDSSTSDGTYYITYTVTDSDDNTTTATRSVIVSDCIDLQTIDQYWDGSSTSALGNANTISLGGATLSTTDGKYGSDSFNFGASGNTAPMTFGNDILLTTGIYTFSLWFKSKRSLSDWGAVLRQTSGGSPGTTANYPIITGDTNNELGLYKPSTFYSTGYDMTSFEAGNTNSNSWNHLAVVADGTSSTFYVNGQQAGSVVNQVITTSVGEIGAYGGNNTQVFAEGIDELAYWDSALLPCQIENIYNSSSKLSSNITYAKHGDITEDGGVYSLDGNGDYLTYNGDHRYTDEFSISIWFKADSSMSQDGILFSNHDAGGAANGNVVTLYTTGKLRVKTADSGGGPVGDAMNIGDGLADGNWHHVAVTWKASTTNGRNIYIDGQLVHQQNVTQPAVYFTTGNSLMHLGAMWHYINNSYIANNWFHGDLANFTIVNSIWTATEVLNDYNNNSPE